MKTGVNNIPADKNRTPSFVNPHPSTDPSLSPRANILGEELPTMSQNPVVPTPSGDVWTD